MKLIKFAASCAAVAVMAFAASANADEIAANLGFEDPMGATGGEPTSAANWFGFDNGAGTVVGEPTTDPNSGLKHAEITISGTPNSFVGIQQVVAATAGENYDFSFFAKDAPGTFDVGIEYRIEWLNSGGGEISRSQLTDTSFGADYSLFTVGGIAPVGTESLRAVIALQSFQGGTTGTARIDDTSIQGPALAVPEPSSLALLGLTTIGLVTRRRRS